MARPPQVMATVDDVKLAALCERLSIEMPRYRFIQAPVASTVHGRALSSSRGIVISLGHYNHGNETLRHVTRQVTHTFLHELRHLFQYATWTTEQWEKNDEYPYRHQPCEIDANEWADRMLPSHTGLIRVSRKYFSRLPG